MYRMQGFLNYGSYLKPHVAMVTNSAEAISELSMNVVPPTRKVGLLLVARLHYFQVTNVALFPLKHSPAYGCVAFALIIMTKINNLF